MSWGPLTKEQLTSRKRKLQEVPEFNFETQQAQVIILSEKKAQLLQELAKVNTEVEAANENMASASKRQRLEPTWADLHIANALIAVAAIGPTLGGFVACVLWCLVKIVNVKQRVFGLAGPTFRAAAQAMLDDSQWKQLQLLRTKNVVKTTTMPSLSPQPSQVLSTKQQPLTSCLEILSSPLPFVSACGLD